MNVSRPGVIAVTDCGSTTTKAILIELRDGEYRQTARGEAPTTVEAPVEDVTVGVAAALAALGADAGRKIIDDRGVLLRPARGGEGVDLFLSTSSAGGGLQMIVAGVVGKYSAAAAERAALGAGAIVVETLSCDDGRTLQERIERLEKLRPDMVLLAGGTDGGASTSVVELAQAVAAAHPRPRFGDAFALPVVYAGNPAVASEIGRILGGRAEFYEVDNVLPSPEEERIHPARERIHELFLEHVMQRAPGFSDLARWTDAPILPTPSAVGAILRAFAEGEGKNVLAVDIGGATTDVFSVVDGAFNRSVSANLGVSYSAVFVLEEAGADGVRRWLPFDISSGEICDAVINKALRPTTIPDDPRELCIEQALAREALRLSFAQHAAFARRPAKVAADRNFDDGLTASGFEGPLVTPGALDVLVGSGGVLSHAPNAAQTFAMLVDAFAPEGITRIAKDSIFMLPHLGALARLHPEAARHVLDRDCIVGLGTCVAPVGAAKLGAECLAFEMTFDDGRVERGAVRFGDVFVLPLGPHAEVKLSVRPAHAFDLGEGRGRAVFRHVRGGEVGVVFDCRGRPLLTRPPGAESMERAARWLRALGAFERWE